MVAVDVNECSWEQVCSVPMTAVALSHTYWYSSVKFSHPSLLPLDTISLVFRSWHWDATESTAGASLSVVTMHAAFDAWSRYSMSLADNWDVPGIMTIPGRQIKLVWVGIFSVSDYFLRIQAIKYSQTDLWYHSPWCSPAKQLD